MVFATINDVEWLSLRARASVSDGNSWPWNGWVRGLGHCKFWQHPLTVQKLCSSLHSWNQLTGVQLYSQFHQRRILLDFLVFDRWKKMEFFALIYIYLLHGSWVFINLHQCDKQKNILILICISWNTYLKYMFFFHILIFCCWKLSTVIATDLSFSKSIQVLYPLKKGVGKNQLN